MLDAITRLGRHIRTPVEHSGHRGHGHPGGLRYGRDRHAPVARGHPTLLASAGLRLKLSSAVREVLHITRHARASTALDTGTKMKPVRFRYRETRRKAR